MAAVYPYFYTFGTRNRFPILINNDSTVPQLEEELRRLDEQFTLYQNGMEQEPQGSIRQMHMNSQTEEISLEMDAIEERINELKLQNNKARNIMNLTRPKGNERFPLPRGVYQEKVQDFLGVKYKKPQGRGLSYKGKKHGFIRGISRMGKGLTFGGALDNANIAQYMSGLYQRLRDAGPAEGFSSDGDFWEAFRYIRENPLEKAGFPNKLLIRVFRMLDERGLLFERIAGQLLAGPFFQNHEDMVDAARDFFINNVAPPDNNA
jgi:hypothetical protein